MIVINIGDKIELYSGSNYEWNIDAKVTEANESVVFVQIRNARGQIDRELVESDDFGSLSAPRWRVQALPQVGQTIHSARGGDTHGCQEGWVAAVTAVDGDVVTATITSNTHCYSCWQTGCVDDGQVDNDMVGQFIAFHVADCKLSQYGDIEARNWSFVS